MVRNDNGLQHVGYRYWGGDWVKYRREDEKGWKEKSWIIGEGWKEEYKIGRNTEEILGRKDVGTGVLCKASLKKDCTAGGSAI